MIANSPRTLASVNELLMAEFEGRVGLATISATVRFCRGELRKDATFEDLEVLARAQLTALVVVDLDAPRDARSPCAAHWA